MKINTKIRYPENSDYTYITEMEKLNLDEECKKSLASGNGFVITNANKNIKRLLVDENGIFSPKFGLSLKDMNVFGDRYKCKCGATTHRVNHGTICPKCNTPVVFVGENFRYFGWIILKDDYQVIHPNIYKILTNFLGKNLLTSILTPVIKKNKDGFTIKDKSKEGDDKYKGIGLTKFRLQYREILDYYFELNNHKKEDIYKMLIHDIPITFTHCIPVYTTHLRPTNAEGTKFPYEKANGYYRIMSVLALELNEDTLKIYRNEKRRENLLYDIHDNFVKLYDYIDSILSDKKGSFKSVFAGRYNFSARSVIIGNPKLRIDEVRLSYNILVELLQQTIINILQKTQSLSYDSAYSIWNKVHYTKDERVYKIIEGLINNPRYEDDELSKLTNGGVAKSGIPILINRNPTIGYGGILLMYVVGIIDAPNILEIPLQSLQMLGADFDGDVLNQLYIINRAFYDSASRVLNPRNVAYISRNDGKFNNAVNHNKDLLINLNSLLYLGRKNYTAEQLERIEKAKHIK